MACKPTYKTSSGVKFYNNLSELYSDNGMSQEQLDQARKTYNEFLSDNPDGDISKFSNWFFGRQEAISTTDIANPEENVSLEERLNNLIVARELQLEMGFPENSDEIQEMDREIGLLSSQIEEQILDSENNNDDISLVDDDNPFFSPLPPGINGNEELISQVENAYNSLNQEQKDRIGSLEDLQNKAKNIAFPTTAEDFIYQHINCKI